MNNKWTILLGLELIELSGKFALNSFSSKYTFDYFKQNTPILTTMYNLSQEEITQILAEIESACASRILPIIGKVSDYETWKLPNTPVQSCSHKWKNYTGLNESFEFCELCDEKKYE